MQRIKVLMSQAKTIAELNLILRNYFAAININSLAFTYYNKHTKTGSKLIYDWVTPALEPWHNYYLESGYADVDRTLESSELSLLPVFWEVKKQLRSSKNVREKRLREESIAFGIDKGLCIPLYGPDGDFVVLVVHQRVNETGLGHWKEHLDTWLGITHTYFHFLRRLLGKKTLCKVSLTKREKECLRLTADGMRLELIAQYLNITERTVNFHIQNANKKLGVANKYLAVISWLNES
jgi:DNA-binding CsgD family transcriptional regulator